LLTPALCYCVVYFYPKSALARKAFFVWGYFSAVLLVIFTISFLSYRFIG
jgi:hypothetical protein